MRNLLPLKICLFSRSGKHSRNQKSSPAKQAGTSLKGLILLVSLLMTGWSEAFAQVSYNISGPTTGNLMRTSTDANTTGATEILAYNAGSSSTNVWSAAQTLPFAFNFYGTPVTSYVVNKNGLLSFDATLAGTNSAANLDVNTALPNANLPNNTIAYFWGDFAPALGSNDDFWSITYGTAPNREHWVYSYSVKMDALSFSYNAVVFEESTNKIYFVDMYNASASGTFTVGVQKDATTAVQLAASPNYAMMNTGSGNTDNSYFTFDPFTLSPNELGVSDIIAPANGCGKTTTETVTVEITNFGTAAQSNFPVTFMVNGPTNTAMVTETVAGPIAPGATLNYTFTGTANLAAVGNYSITAATALATDANTTNDAMTETVASYNPLTGTYTINSANPTSATNFTSFTDAVTALNTCGVTGAVTFNVAATSGPYTEHIELMPITGASATNTITFNGNGRTLQADPMAGTPAVITLKGADFVKFDNLVIETTGTTSSSVGWGIHFTNGADNNTISNNTINIGSTSTSESNSVGIVFVNSTTSVTTTGGNNGNNNVIANNTINGGYKAIHLNNDGASAGNNQITGNMLKDFYASGVEVNGAVGTLIENNNISRPTRTSVTTFYGIYVSGNAMNTVVNKNRIHNTHGGATSLTGTVYGLYTTSTDATTGSENIYKNNLIYNIGGTSTVYGIYNSSSDGAYYYHNTVDLTMPNNTGTVRGFYQTTTATNIKVLNNIFTVNAGTSGTKTVLYFNTTGSDIMSNNNVLYVDPSATNQHIGYYSGNKTTLADWKGANTTTPFDLNSVSADPQYVDVATGNLKPTSGAVNNIAQPLAAVTMDITGATRNTTTPDPGAYEFTPATNDAGVIAIVSPVSATCGASNQETVTITVQNFGLAALTNILVTYQLNGGTFVTTETMPGPIAPGASADYSFTAKADLSAGGAFTILAKTMLSGDALAANDAASATINILNPISTFPHLEDFETFTTATNATGYMNGWEVMPEATTSSFRWNVDVGTTPSSDTGPGVDHTLGSANGKYIFTEASSGSAGDTATVTSPCISLPTGSAIGMEFWYHMYGSDMGTLHVDIYDGTSWVRDVMMISGPQQTASADAWRRALVPLTTYAGSTIKVRFRGERGNDFRGDMSVDDVRFFTLPAVDLQVTSVTLPNAGCGLSNAETVCISVKNLGATAASNIPVSYAVNGGTAVNETIAGPLAPGATMQYCFTAKADFSVAGPYAVVATVTATGDADTSNDSATGNTLSKPVISTFPYTEGFENGTGDWVAAGVNATWALGTPSGTVISTAGGGTNSWVTNLSGNYNDNARSSVTSPCFNFTNVPNPTISMKIFWDIENSWDGAVLQSSIDGGMTWQNVGAYQDPNNWYNDNTINAGPGDQPGASAEGWTGTGTTGSGGWVTASHALTGLGGQASVQLRIAFASDGSTVKEGFAFDDVSISNIVAAPTVTAGGPTTFCQGGSVLLTAASATPGVTYTWELNGTPIAGATGNTYTATASGNYTAVANLSGSATSTPITVTVDPAPATPNVTAAGATTFCDGGSVSLTAASTTSGATYQWFLDGTAITGATSATYTANTAGNYTVVATSGNCSSTASAATAVTVNAAPATPTISQNGGTLTSSAATGNQWYLNGNPIAGATGQTLITTANGVYTVVATNANGCPSAASAAQNVTNTGLGDALAGMSVQVYPNPATGSFNLKLNGYQKDATVVLYSLTGQQIITETATADGKATNISLKGLAAGTYLLKVTSDKGVQVNRLVVK